MNSLIRSAIISTFRPAAAAAAEVDTNFANTVLLLHGDGTNGAQNQTFLDSGTANTGGTGFTITRNGNTTQGTFSPFSQTGWSNFFASNTTAVNYLTTPSVTLSGDFTIEGYVYWDGVGVNPNFFTVGDSGLSSGLEIYRSNGNWILYGSNATRITGSAAVIGQWTYIALTRSGSTVTMYIDGISQGTWTSSTTFSGTVKIGAEFYNSTYYSSMSGYISNFRINNTTAINTVPTAPLTAVSGTILLTCQSNRFVDNSASPLTITVNGSSSVQAFSPFAPTAAYSAATNGGSGYFDGTTDYLQVADNNALDFGTGDFTVEGWYYSTAATTTLQTVFSVGRYDAGVFLRIGTHPGGDSFYINATNYNWDPTTYFKSYQWNHVVVARTGTTVGIFVNGTRVFNTTNSDNIVPTTSTTIAGATHDLSGLFFTGYINGFRIIKGSGPYDATSSTLTVPTAPLTAITNTSLLCNFTNAGIIDQTSKNVLETVGNAQIDTGTKKFGTGSLEFDGNGDYIISTRSNPDLIIGKGNFTVEGWFYFNNTPSTMGLFQMSSTAGGFAPNQTKNLAVATASSTTWQIYAKDTFTTSSSTTVPVTTWTHFALVRNGTTTVLYIGGTAIITVTSDSTDYNTPYLGIGGIYDNSSYLMNGYIDDLRITKGVARYTANFTAPTKAFADQ